MVSSLQAVCKQFAEALETEARTMHACASPRIAMPKRLSEEVVKKIGELASQGLSPAQIAATLKLTKGTVYKYLKRLGKGGKGERKPRGRGSRGGASEEETEVEDEELMKMIRELAMEGEGGEEERGGKKEEKAKARDLMIEAMKMLDEGVSPIEVMVKY